MGRPELVVGVEAHVRPGPGVKRYLVFASQDYYPLGGWSDFHSSHDSIEGAREALAAIDEYDRRIFQIIDSTTGDAVTHSEEPNQMMARWTS